MMMGRYAYEYNDWSTRQSGIGLLYRNQEEYEAYYYKTKRVATSYCSLCYPCMYDIRCNYPGSGCPADGDRCRREKERAIEIMKIYGGMPANLEDII